MIERCILVAFFHKVESGRSGSEINDMKSRRAGELWCVMFPGRTPCIVVMC